MKYYHATDEDSARKIISDGYIKTGFDGAVYLADSATNAAKFKLIRLTPPPIVIFEVDSLDDLKISESFDHNESFFKCKAYVYMDNIPVTNVTNVYTVE